MITFLDILSFETRSILPLITIITIVNCYDVPSVHSIAFRGQCDVFLLALKAATIPPCAVLQLVLRNSGLFRYAHPFV